MLRSFLMACVLVVVPLQGPANPTAETEEMDFLDLVDGEGNVLIQAQGVDAAWITPSAASSTAQDPPRSIPNASSNDLPKATAFSGSMMKFRQNNDIAVAASHSRVFSSEKTNVVAATINAAAADATIEYMNGTSMEQPFLGVIGMLCT